MAVLEQIIGRRGAGSPALPDKVGRPFWLAVLALLALHLVLAWLARPGGIGTLQDDAIYLFLARSLREFGYNDLYLAGSPAHHMYPPLYPAALAALTLVFGERIALLQAFGIAASAAALGVLAVVVRRLWSSGVAVAALAALVVNPHLLGTAGKIGTDSLYLLLSLIAVAVLARRNPPARLLVVAAAAAIASALTRSVGVALLAGIWAHWLIERRFLSAALFTAAGAATVGVWLLWTALAPEQYVGRSYIADATFRPSQHQYPLLLLLVGRAVHHLGQYFGAFIPNRIGIPPLPGPAAVDLLAAALVAAALLAGIAVLWKRWRAGALYLLAYGALLTVWTWSIGRFLNVVIPLLVLAVLLGARALAERLRPGAGMPVLAAVALSLVFFGSVRAAKLVMVRNTCEWGSQLPAPECRRNEQGAFFDALEYVNRNLPRDAVIVSGKPAPLYYFTRRQTLLLAKAVSPTPEEFIAFLDEQNARYVVLARLHAQEYGALAPLLEVNCASLALLAEFEPQTYVFRVLAPGTTTEESPACRALAEYRKTPFRAEDS